jgi:amidase
MRMRCLLLLCAILGATPLNAQSDLLEVTVPQLQAMYRSHRYTVTQVVQWYLARIDRYNGIYRAIQTVDAAGALATAASEDAHANSPHDALWGVPIVLKANTSIKGKVTTDGWKGYMIPGHELVAPQDAPIVARLKAAGAIILGQTNMPDFAASDTNRSTAYGRTGNAYDVRFSPGGSSGGTVTAVTANMAVLGNGTDTGNSIRMPAATSSVVGVFPTRGLVSIEGIAPLDWLLDNTGPIARDVTDATIALDVMKGNDAQAEPGPYTRYLKPDALKGKRFGVPVFILEGAGIPFGGIAATEPQEKVAADRIAARIPLQPETRAAFLKALDGLRAAGATVVFDDSILPDSFAETASHVCTRPYIREGTAQFLAAFGPAEYHSPEEYARAVGSPLPDTIIGGSSTLETDPNAEANFYGPRRTILAMYNETLDRLHLDGYVYPAIQMPPPDETMPQDGQISGGPHSDTSWVNMIGVPAVVVPGGFYPDGLPFGLEISARPWRDGDLLGWAYAYEQATQSRRPPVLVEKGLLPNAR